MAKMQDSEELTDKIFALALEKYSTTSIDSITLNNWGFAYYEQALIKKGNAKLLLLDEAEKKYKG